MAEHTLAILVKAIGAGKAAQDLKGVDRAISNIGGRAGKGLRTAGSNLLRIGAVAGGIAAGLGAIAVKGGIESLATLESAVTSVNGAIKQMGLTGQVTGNQVATWANEIEASVHAAFDDKDITQATSTLVRFGKVTPQNLRPAMVVMTDLAAKTGSVDSAATLLSKAFADPTKAAGKLARQGVILTKAEQKQVAAFVKAGKVGAAQKVILDAVARSTKGAADASQGPYAKAMSTLKDVTEDAERALATAFLPVLEKTANWLSKTLADPHVQSQIKDFGTNLANAFDKVIEFAKKLPWGAIVDGLRTAAGVVKGLFDAFASMPPEVQTTLIALAGLNKLSGGAISGIVGELGKGLIKGVLGMTAGVVNIKAGVVNGGGGIGGGAGAGAGALAGEGLLASVGLTAATMTGLTVGIGTVVAAAILTDRNINDKGGLGPAMQPITNGGATFGTNVTIKDPQIQGARFFGGKGSALVINPNTGGNNIKPGGVSNGPLGEHAAAEATVSAVDRMKNRLAGLLERQQHAKDSGDTGRAHALHAKIVDLKGQIRTSESATARAVADTQRATDRAKAAVDSAKAAQVAQIRATGSTTGVAIGGTTTAVATAQGAIVAALHSIPAPVVNVSVSPTTINKYNTINNRSGSVGGSRGRTNDRGKG